MGDLVKLESLLGNKKVVVGNHLNDLVLETLGKVYIKSGKNLRLLNDLFKLLDSSVPETTSGTTKTIIVEDTSSMYNLEYPGDGYFIFNKGNSILYMSFNNDYTPLIEVKKNLSSSYVKTSGDTMTGALEIFTSGAPLKVVSTELNKNFNANYLNGKTDNYFAKKFENESITGNWEFRGKNTSKDTWVFDRDVIFKDNVVTYSNLSSPEFESGFTGYGWMLDASTNTLTIDNLVVRKAMRVYEMVINKIRATNGSLWVSNSATCEEVIQPDLLVESTLYKSDGTINNVTWSLQEITEGEDEIVIDSYWQLSNLGTDYFLVNPTTTTNTSGSFSGIVKKSGTDIKTIQYNYLLRIINRESFIKEFIDLTQQEESSYLINNLLEYLQDPNFLENCKLTYLKVFKIDYSKFIDSVFRVRVQNTIDSSNTYSEVDIKLYHKYFGLQETSNNNYYIIKIDDDYPPFMPGDILRCQKVLDGNTKYYDALFINHLFDSYFIVQTTPSVFDKYTKISVNSEGNVVNVSESYNKNLYALTNSDENGFGGDYSSFELFSEDDLLIRTEDDFKISTENEFNGEASLSSPNAKDDLIQIGNIFDTSRQNAIYLTSTDDGGPYIDIISGLNRPDFASTYEALQTNPYYVLIGDKKYYIVRDTITSVTAEKCIAIQYDYDKKNIKDPQDPNTIWAEIPTDQSTDTEVLINGKSYTLKSFRGGTNSGNAGKDILLKGKLVSSLNSYVLGISKYERTTTTKVRLGNLDGIYNPIFGNKQPNGYGLYASNVFLTGEFYLNNGKSVADIGYDGIFLKFANSGLSIVDDCIVLQSNKIKFVAGDDDIPLFDTSKGTVTISNNLLDINGWVKANNKIELTPNKYYYQEDGETKEEVYIPIEDTDHDIYDPFTFIIENRLWKNDGKFDSHIRIKMGELGQIKLTDNQSNKRQLTVSESKIDSCDLISTRLYNSLLFYGEYTLQEAPVQFSITNHIFMDGFPFEFLYPKMTSSYCINGIKVLTDRNDFSYIFINSPTTMREYPEIISAHAGGNGNRGLLRKVTPFIDIRRSSYGQRNAFDNVGIRITGQFLAAAYLEGNVFVRGHIYVNNSDTEYAWKYLTWSESNLANEGVVDTEDKNYLINANSSNQSTGIR